MKEENWVAESKFKGYSFPFVRILAVSAEVGRLVPAIMSSYPLSKSKVVGIVIEGTWMLSW